MDSTNKVPNQGAHASQSVLILGGRMRRLPNSPFGQLATVLGCLILACTSCVAAGGEAALIQQVELVGDWSTADGARVHMSADHKFSASEISHAVPGYECPTELAGTWQFWVQDGPPTSYVASDSATEGESFLVSVDADSSTSWCDLQGQVQRDDQGFSICLVLDLDQSCTSDELLRKDSTRPGRPR